jgi:hypothetical protein
LFCELALGAPQAMDKKLSMLAEGKIAEEPSAR